MASIRALIFDFIGTLTNVRNYSLEDSKMQLHNAIVKTGFDIDSRSFLEAYGQAHEKYRVMRYRELVEVTNAVWISEALNNLGFKTKPEDARVEAAVNVFFERYVDSLELRPCARNMLGRASVDYRLGLVSNFTYAPVIHEGLRKLRINQFFKAILISEEIGWRKPSPRIFDEALKRLRTTAKETIYVGDSPLEDIKGAKAVGMETVFVPSQFYTLRDLVESQQKPDLIVEDICELCERFPIFLSDTKHANVE
jgi:putative hydrolase of the HAD superfamily